LFTIPSPLIKLNDLLFDEAGIELFIKRDDLIHPQISGNKWRKLKFNFLEAEKLNKRTIVTFGGAYSNHIYATAAAGKLFGYKTIGIIRGEEQIILNPTLNFATECGMELIYLSREEYKNKEINIDKTILKYSLNDFYIISEGGSNALGVKGCAEIVNEIDIPFNYICCPCGTGTTLAGLVSDLNNSQTAIGFSALKGGDFLVDDVKTLLSDYYKHERKESSRNSNFNLQTDYHFGGYAKSNEVLFDFIRTFEKRHSILIEQVYTAKMFFGIYELIKIGYFKKGETIIALHTGGVQGRDGKI